MTPDVLHLCAPATPPVARETIRLCMGQRTPDGETESPLMSPTKSVTAIVGLENQENDT